MVTSSGSPLTFTSARESATVPLCNELRTGDRSSVTSSSVTSKWDYFLGDGRNVRWSVLLAAGFLVSAPVFVQAPLVRSLPVVSLVGTIAWIWLSIYLSQRSATRVWGELVAGFSWTWLSGSLYWGWLRTEPLWHLPIEALGLPFAILALRKGWCRVGVLFYLGSLFGTVVTDVYFHLLDLTGVWRRVMLDPTMAEFEFAQALKLMNTPLGYSSAAVLLSLLVAVGMYSVRRRSLASWACGGAILSTLVVDGLFWGAAIAGSR